MTAKHLLLFPCSEKGNIFYIMHEQHDMAQIVHKTNRLIISGVASHVWVLELSPMPCTGRWKVAKTGNQGNIQSGGGEQAIDIFHDTHWCYISCQNYRLSRNQYVPQTITHRQVRCFWRTKKIKIKNFFFD